MDGYIKWIREQVGSQKILLVFASICIVDERGRLLWQQRGDFGWWGLPGGVLELAEDLQSCAIREAKEETGLDVALTGLVGVYSSPDYDVVYPNGDEVHQVTFCFRAQIVGGSLAVDQHETLALRWHGPDAIPETAIWYQHMAEDLFANRPDPNFTSGSPGTARDAEPYYRKIRRYIGQAAFIAPSAAMAVFNDVGEILLVKRSDNGAWSLPGGMLEPGERLDQTAGNEVREETGLIIEPVRLLGVYSNEHYRFKYPHGDEIKYASSLFRCRVVGGELAADQDEVSDARFFPVDALPEMPPRHAIRVRAAIRNGRETVIS